jgi:hypothetical protein
MAKREPAAASHVRGLSEKEQARRTLQFLKTSNAQLLTWHGNRVELTRQMKVLQRVVGDRQASAALNGYLQRRRAVADPLQRQDLDDEELLQGRLAGGEAMVQRREVADQGENRTGMPDQLKAGLEDLSGLDLSDVRVHYNSPKPADVNALAYAQGRDIHLGRGQEQHLPHEGWHVVQQAQGRVKPTMQAQGVPINDDAGLEREADQMGARASAVSETARSGELAPIDRARSDSDEFLVHAAVSQHFIQRKYNGKTEASNDLLREIRELLQGMGVSISSDHSSLRNKKIAELIEDKDKSYELIDLINEVNDLPVEVDEGDEEYELSGDSSWDSNEEAGDTDQDDSELESFLEDEAEREQQARKEEEKERLRGEIREHFRKTPTVAYVFWGASHLPERMIAILKEHYKRKEDEPEGQGAMRPLAEYIIECYRKAVGKAPPRISIASLQQALEQEVIQAESIHILEKELSSMGVNDLKIFRPVNELLIRPHCEKIKKSWNTFRTFDSVELEKEKKTILVTITHGTPMGEMWYGAMKTMSQGGMAEELDLAGKKNALFYVPVQCYPGLALDNAKALGWVARGLTTRDRSTDYAMRDWIEECFVREIHEWAKSWK